MRWLAVWLGALMPFEQAARILEKVGQVPLSASTVWRQVRATGTQAQALEIVERAQTNAVPKREHIVPGEARSTARLAVVMDGAMIHIRDEGFKELKVGGVGQIELETRRDRATGDDLELAHTVANTYVAHLGGPETFGQLVWAEAYRRDWSRAADTAVIGDGAKWIWNLAGEHFFDSAQIVDWYHAKQHLWAAAHLLHGEGTAEAKQWVTTQETPLFEGHAERLADGLCPTSKRRSAQTTQLHEHAHYFRENHRRMQYLEFRENNYPIGSGTAESGCKQFRARFTGSGMRWSRPGAERLLPLRAAVMSDRFDVLWKAWQAMPQN